MRVFQGRDEKGKRISHNKTIHGNKSDAQKYLNGYLRDRDLGVFVGTADTTVNALLDSLLLDYKTNGKRYDWASLVVRVHLRPFFGAMKAAKVGTQCIQSYIACRREATKRRLENGKTRNIAPTSNGTINREFTLLRRAFNLGKQETPPKVAVVPKIPFLAENSP